MAKPGNLPKRKIPTQTTQNTYWNYVAKQARANPGKWVPARPKGKSTPDQVALNINKGRIRSLQGMKAVVRNRTVYVTYTPNQQ